MHGLYTEIYPRAVTLRIWFIKEKSQIVINMFHMELNGVLCLGNHVWPKTKGVPYPGLAGTFNHQSAWTSTIYGQCP